VSLSSEASEAMRKAYLEIYLLAGYLEDGRIIASMADETRLQTETILQENRAELFRAGVPEKWVNEIELPLVGLIDEAARNSPVTGLKERWRPIQFRKFGHEEVGRVVFDHLKELRMSPDTPVEVLEVYARCISVGFRGIYAVIGEEGLRILEEGLRNELIRRLGTLPALSRHLSSGPDGQDGPRILEPRWIAAIAGALVLLVALGMTAFLSIDANQIEGTLRTMLVKSPGGAEVAPK